MTLTTITPYWKRPQMLAIWLRCLRNAACPEVQHHIYFVGEPIPGWWAEETKGLNIVAFHQPEEPGLSIGHYHNLGARQATTEWIMKLDIDTLPHTVYFSHLLPILKDSGRREWFNGGMFYLNEHYSRFFFNGQGVLSPETYQTIMSYPQSYSASSYFRPAASNFICRKQIYLSLGGCSNKFRGYGWEDYQQIYMLEKHQRQADPLPGYVDLKNVTQRCRDEISRRKAKELVESNHWLCLIHHWHPRIDSPYFHSMAANRQVLLDYIRPCPSRPNAG